MPGKLTFTPQHLPGSVNCLITVPLQGPASTKNAKIASAASTIWVALAMDV